MGLAKLINSKRSCVVLMLTTLFVTNNLLAATVTLNTSGNFSDATIWSSNPVLPGAADDVEIGGTNFTLTVDQNNVTVASIANNPNGFTLTLQANINFTITGILDANNNVTINVPSTSTLTVGSIDARNSVTLTINGNVQVNGDVTFNGGGGNTLTVNGTLNVDGNLDTGGVDINGSGTVTADVCGNVGTGGAITCSSTLPVTLGNFQAFPIQSDIELEWYTLTEENFEYFSVQRSRDLLEWEEIGHVEGGGDSEVRRDYNYTDRSPWAGTSYYRLQSFDYDGYTEVFNAVVVFLEEAAGFRIFPTWVRGDFITIQSPRSEEFRQVKIIDLSGRSQYEVTLSSHEVMSLPTLLPNAPYILELREGNYINRARFVLSR